MYAIVGFAIGSEVMPGVLLPCSLSLSLSLECVSIETFSVGLDKKI